MLLATPLTKAAASEVTISAWVYCPEPYHHSLPVSFLLSANTKTWPKLLQNCNEIAQMDDGAKSVIHDLNSRDGVYLSANTMSEHADRIDVSTYVLAHKAELSVASEWIAYIYIYIYIACGKASSEYQLK